MRMTRGYPQLIRSMSIRILFVEVILFCFFATTAIATERERVVRGATEIQLVKHDLSPALRDIPPIPVPQGVKRVRPIKLLPPLVPDPNRPVTGESDPGAQLSDGSPAIPVPNRNFLGVGNGFSGPQGSFTVQYAPPDTNGDVGPNHYVQTVNVSFAIWNKSGSVIYGPAAINTLWSGFGGGCQNNNDGDPTVTYDQFNDRWIIAQFSVSNTPYLECIAVSKTGDPTGQYWRFSYQFTDFPDYPKTAVWNGDYYITYNMFAGGSFFVGGKVCAHQGSKLRAGQANTMQCFDTPNDGGLLAADQDGNATAPAGAPEFVSAFRTNSLAVWKFKPDFTTPANSTFTGPTIISVNAFTPACNGGTCISQPGTTQQLDSIGDRLMNRLAYRNRSGTESFVLNHSVSVSGISAIRWYELRTSNSATATPTLFQQGTYSPDTNHRWMGSVAMDKDGNIAAGYSVSSSANNVKPSIRYAGRLLSDPAGQLSQGESALIAGAGSQTGGLNRWGDYSALNIDPSDDCTFWITHEYLQVNGSFNWSTRIGSFRFSTCAGSGDVTPPTTSITAPVNGATVSGITPLAASANDNVGVTTVEFFVDDLFQGSDTSSPYTTNWDTTGVGNGPHSITSRAYDAAGNAGSSSTIAVTVNNPGQAGYDSVLKAPKCSAVTSYCSSGPALLNGRGAVGPEPNAPNTINNSCADGNSGSYHSDESLDALKVATNDVTSLAAGKSVIITATAFCYDNTDSLDLYYAANANSPSWVLIGTQACTTGGVTKIFASNYTLPAGSLQAIRGNFRFGGSQSSCSTGSYDDHDDLIFTVGAGVPDSTPPTTSITAPSGGVTVSGTIPVKANASDNIGVTKVQFFVDGSTLLGTDTIAPYSINWNTTGIANGNHNLTSKAYDGANNVGTSAPVSVTVNNSACGTTSQLLLNPGFESGAVNWNSSAGVITNSASRPSHTGAWKAWLNGNGTSNTEFAWQQITIPANACSAKLTFWLRIDTAETTTTVVHDRLLVRILNTSGIVVSTLATYSNLNKNLTFTKKTFDLLGFKGQTIRVRFQGTEDASKQTSFVIDDTALNITQ